MMPRKDVKLTVEDWQRVSNFAKASMMDSKNKEVLKTMNKFVAWVENEINRREKSGKLGGRPKKQIKASPELIKTLDVLLPKVSANYRDDVVLDEEYR